MHRPERTDDGFTLVELLVVMVVIGILAAIAVPLFLNQRQRGVETSMRSDLRTVAQLMETFYIDTRAYPPDVATLQAAIPPPTAFSRGNAVAVVPAFTAGSAYCLLATNAGARDIYFDSDDGGLLAPGVPCT